MTLGLEFYRISLMLDTDRDGVGEFDIVVKPPPAVAGLLQALEGSVVAADEATRAAMSARREVAELLRAEGFPLRDVGRLIGVSHQRVSQLPAG